MLSHHGSAQQRRSAARESKQNFTRLLLSQLTASFTRISCNQKRKKTRTSRVQEVSIDRSRIIRPSLKAPKRQKQQVFWELLSNSDNFVNPRLTGHFRGSQKGGFQKSGFGGCSLVPKTGTRVHSGVPWHEKAEQGYMRMFPGTKNWNKGTFAKTAFYETALLFPLDHLPFPYDKEIRRLANRNL